MKKKNVFIICISIGVILLGVSFSIFKKNEVTFSKEKRDKYFEYLRKEEYAEAEEYINSLVKDKERFNKLPKKQQGTIYSQLGTLHLIQNNFVKGMYYYELALPLLDRRTNLTIKNNMAVVHRYFRDYVISTDIAVEILEELGIEPSKNKQEYENQFYALINLAENFFQLGQADNLEKVIQRLKKLRKNTEIQDGEIEQKLIIKTYEVILRFMKGESTGDAIAIIEKLSKEDIVYLYSETPMYILRAKMVYYYRENEYESLFSGGREALKYAEKYGDIFNEQFFLNLLESRVRTLGTSDEHYQLLLYYHERIEENIKNQTKDYDVYLKNKIQFRPRLRHNIRVIFYSLIIILIIMAILIYRYWRTNQLLINKVYIDELCQIYNRRYLEKILKLISIRDGPHTFLMIDVDYFKQYNDYYGHKQGDWALHSVATILKQCAGDHGMVSRYGGEEFAVLFKGQPLEVGIKYAIEVKKSLEEHAILHQQSKISKYLTLSIGVVEVIEKNDVKQMISYADKALYEAKKKGRNGYSIYRQGENE